MLRFSLLPSIRLSFLVGLCLLGFGIMAKAEVGTVTSSTEDWNLPTCDMLQERIRASGAREQELVELLASKRSFVSKSAQDLLLLLSRNTAFDRTRDGGKVTKRVRWMAHGNSLPARCFDQLDSKKVNFMSSSLTWDASGGQWHPDLTLKTTEDGSAEIEMKQSLVEACFADATTHISITDAAGNVVCDLNAQASPR